VELVVVLDAVESYAAELERTSHVCAELSRELGLVVSRVFTTEPQWPVDAAGAVAVFSEATA
jgi:hypothetical protein